MNILVIGGTKFFGIPMVNELLKKNHTVTIASRGLAKDPFENRVNRIIFDRSNEESIQEAFQGKYYDLVIDKIAYSSNDVNRLLKVLKCGKYILMSSTAVYDLHIDTKEDDFDPCKKELVYCDRYELSYGKTKQQAECIMARQYVSIPSIYVRYPFVIGKNDYTKRLLFYVQHIQNQIPMYIDNLDAQMSFITEEDAGRMIAMLVDHDYTGPINGASEDTISLAEVIHIIEDKLNLKALLDPNGDKAPYNGTNEYSINVDQAKALGYHFSNLHQYIDELISYYIKR